MYFCYKFILPLHIDDFNFFFRTYIINFTSSLIEDEQKSLKARISELECEIATDKENSLNVNHFLNLVKRYTEVPELTTEIIREFIEKAYAYHPEKVNGKKTQRVRIIWNCIGEIPT